MTTTTQTLRNKYLALRKSSRRSPRNFDNMCAMLMSDRGDVATPANWVSAALATLEMDGHKEDGVCGKCEGKGRINAFSHYANGECFWCNGTGKLAA